MTQPKINTLFLLFSQFFSVIGTTMLQFIIALYILDFTNSAQTFSFVIAVTFIGRLLSLPFCGIIIDRFSKKKMMLLLDFCYLFLTTLYLLISKIQTNLMSVFIFVFIIGLISAFETPLSQASLGILYSEDDIPKMTGIITAIGMLGTLVGPILASLIYRFNATSVSFLMCAALFLFACLCEVLLQISEPKAQIKMTLKKTLQTDYLEVFQVLKQKPLIIKICTLAFLLNFIISSFIQVVIPYIARIILKVTEPQFGMMNTFFAFCGIIGAILYSLMIKKIQLNIKYLFNLISFIFIIFGFSFFFKFKTTFVFSLMTFTIGLILLLVSLLSVHLIAIIQLQIEKNLVGRIMAFVLILSTLATPIGQLIWGATTQQLNQSDFFWIGLFNAGITLLIYFVFRKTLDQIPEPVAT